MSMLQFSDKSFKDLVACTVNYPVGMREWAVGMVLCKSSSTTFFFFFKLGHYCFSVDGWKTSGLGLVWAHSLLFQEWFIGFQAFLEYKLWS